MNIQDRAKHKYEKDINGSPLTGIVIKVIDPSIKPYCNLVKWNGLARNPWSSFPLGNYKDSHLEEVSA